MKNNNLGPAPPVKENCSELVQKTERKNTHELISFITNDLIIKAEIIRNKAVKLCEKQEYFEALQQAQKCSRLFKMNNKNIDLPTLKFNNKSAYKIIYDCQLYSSISYILMYEFDKAIRLSSELIKCDENLKDVETV